MSAFGNGNRERSVIEWAIRMHDAITGGTIFWLNSGIDRGNIAYQDWCFIPLEYYLNPKEGAKSLWKDEITTYEIKSF